MGASNETLAKLRAAAHIGNKCLNLLSAQLGQDQETEVDGDACKLMSGQIDPDNPNMVVIVLKVDVGDCTGTVLAAHHVDGDLHTVHVTATT